MSLTRQQYNKATLKQRLQHYGVYIATRLDSWTNPTTIAYKNHLYHVNLTFSSKDNTRIAGYRLGDNGWNDKNKLYDLPGNECFVLNNINL